MLQSVEPRSLKLRVDRVALDADFAAVPDARGVIIFAHGSGSGRHSPRNRTVAEYLRRHAQVSTLLVDLLSEGERALDFGARSPDFDVELLAERLVLATDWVLADDVHGTLPIGYFGSSTGAGAALLASTTRNEVTAVVSRGGRPDLATSALPLVRAPTLLIVGSQDHEVLELNRMARSRIGAKTELASIDGAGHLFEEPGTLTQVAELSRSWFSRYLQQPLRRSARVSSSF